MKHNRKEQLLRKKGTYIYLNLWVIEILMTTIITYITITIITIITSTIINIITITIITITKSYK